MDKKIMDERLSNDLADKKLLDEQPPPPPYTSESQDSSATSRVFKVTYKNAWGKTLYLQDPQDDTSHYEADYHMRKPHLRAKQLLPVQRDLAKASCHTFSSKLDVEIYGHPEFLLAQGGDGSIKSWKKPFVYTSPNLQQTLSIRSKNAYYDYSFTVETEDGQILARLVPKNCGLKKTVGNLQIFGSNAENAAFVDEMAAMTLTMVQYITVHIAGVAGAVASS